MKRRTEERLIAAGWKQDRMINIEFIEKRYKKYGMLIPNSVKFFLQKYGMITIKFKKVLAHVDINEEISFNPVEVLGDYLDKEYFKTIVDDYSEEVKEELFPVGMIARGNMILMMTASEMFFSYTDGCLCKDGDNIDEMLDCVVGECRLPIIYE